MQKIDSWISNIHIVWSDIVSLYHIEKGINNDNSIQKEELIHKINNHRTNLEKEYNILDWSFGFSFISDSKHDDTLGARNILLYIEDKILHIDDNARNFLIKSIGRKSYWMLAGSRYDENRQIANFFSEYSQSGFDPSFVKYLEFVMFCFTGQLYMMCSDLNIQMENILYYDLDVGFASEVDLMFSSPEVNPNEKTYKRLERTHAIAAIDILLQRLKVYATTDKTKIAEFIEAVTGGNINVKGKDTMSYKSSSMQAVEAAKKLLEKINL